MPSCCFSRNKRDPFHVLELFVGEESLQLTLPISSLFTIAHILAHILSHALIIIAIIILQSKEKSNQWDDTGPREMFGH
jgi:hypothetical protein